MIKIKNQKISNILKFEIYLYSGVFLFLFSVLLFLYSLFFTILLSIVDIAFFILVISIILIIIAAYYSKSFDTYSMNKIKEDIVKNKIIMAILSIMGTLFVVPFVFMI